MQEQREMPFPAVIAAAQWVESEEVKRWQTFRDAVLWCWEHRPERGQKEQGDQAMFRHLCKRVFKADCHAPHISRWVNKNTKAPMNLPQDLEAAFESFTGWRGLTQWHARRASVTLLEEMKARLAA